MAVSSPNTQEACFAKHQVVIDTRVGKCFEADTFGSTGSRCGRESGGFGGEKRGRKGVMRDADGG